MPQHDRSPLEFDRCNATSTESLLCSVSKPEPFDKNGGSKRVLSWSCHQSENFCWSYEEGSIGRMDKVEKSTCPGRAAIFPILNRVKCTCSPSCFLCCLSKSSHWKDGAVGNSLLQMNVHDIAL